MVEDKQKINNYSGQSDPLGYLSHILYIYIGRHLLENKRFNSFFYSKIYKEKYEDILKQSNMKILPEEFFMMTILWFVMTFFLMILTLITLSRFDLISISFGSILIGLIVVVGIGFGMYNYPRYISNERARYIDASIPHILPYMKLLSSDLPLSNMVILMDEFLVYKETKKEFEKIRYYNEFIGLDLVTAIRRAMASCPSKKLSELMNDIVAISNSGGDIYSYLETKLEHLNVEIEAIERQSNESTMILSQVYIVFLLIGPLLGAVVLSIFSFISFADLGGGAGGSQTLYFIFMLLVLPVLYGLFYGLVIIMKPLYSRIKVEEENNGKN